MVEKWLYDSRRLFWVWCFVVGPCLAIYLWLDHSTSQELGHISRGVSPIYTGLRWLRFHRANEPTNPKEYHIVVIGSSNFAGWGDDYRFFTRQRADLWGRHSFAANLERNLKKDGIQARVSNLAVNGARLRSQIFLFLYALRSKPDLMIFALSSWSFIRDGDFLDPKPMLQMNTALTQILSEFNDTKEDPFLKDYLTHQPHPPLKERLQVSPLDEVAAWTAIHLDHLYRKIGLPESLVFPSPKRFVDEVQKMEEEARKHPDSQDLKPSPIFQEMVDLFPHALSVLKAAADQKKIPMMALLPPSTSRWANWFYSERAKEIQQNGICLIDLRYLPMHSEEQTFDGYHFTRRGNEELARAFYEVLQQEKGRFP